MAVDAAVAGSIIGLSWGRFETLLAAKIIEADRAAEEQAKIWRRKGSYVPAAPDNRVETADR